MPNSPKRPCTYPGCGALTDGGRCEKHRKQQRKEADKQRGTSTQRGYGFRWQKTREGWLRAHPLCGDRENGNSGEHSGCRRDGRVTVATDVDHIKPHNGDQSLFWDPNNWQSLCHECHSTKTASEDGGFGNPGRAG